MIRYFIRKYHARQEEAKREQLELAIEDNGVDVDPADLEDTLDAVARWSIPLWKKLGLFLMVLGLILTAVFLMEGYGTFMIAYVFLVPSSVSSRTGNTNERFRKKRSLKATHGY